jgi:hypothetical protein
VAGDNFDVCGHHAIISPVQLPPWLPHYIMKQMVAQFKNTLHQEILAMIQTKQHFHHPSPQSTSYSLHIANGGSGSVVGLGFPKYIKTEPPGVTEANVATPTLDTSVHLRLKT